MTTVHSLHASTWLRAATYSAGALALLTKDGRAILHYRVPSWAVGLLVAADRRAERGQKTGAGEAYNAIVKGRFPAASSLEPEYRAGLEGIAKSMRRALWRARARRPESANRTGDAAAPVLRMERRA